MFPEQVETYWGCVSDRSAIEININLKHFDVLYNSGNWETWMLLSSQKEKKTDYRNGLALNKIRPVITIKNLTPPREQSSSCRRKNKNKPSHKAKKRWPFGVCKRRTYTHM